MSRAERAVQVVLLLGVGGVAAAASWSHVVALATAHGQHGWLAVADAAVIETLAVSAGLEIRRRRSAGQRAGFVLAVLVGSAVLSLAAQVAEAERSVWGWLMAGVPAAAFLVLVKIALGRPASARENSDENSDPQPPAARSGTPSGHENSDRNSHRPGVAAAPEVRPEVRTGSSGHALGAPPTDPEVRTGSPAPVLSPGEDQDRSGTGEDRVGDREDGPVPDGPDPLFAAGRAVLADLEQAGAPLTRAALIEGLRARDVKIGTGRATGLLRQLRAQPDPMLNGSRSRAGGSES